MLHRKSEKERLGDISKERKTQKEIISNKSQTVKEQRRSKNKTGSKGTRHKEREVSSLTTATPTLLHTSGDTDPAELTNQGSCHCDQILPVTDRSRHMHKYQTYHNSVW